MFRSSLLHLGLVAALISACGLDSGEPASLTPASVAAAPSISASERIPLPAGFPVPPGASPVAMPDDDPGLIGLWTTEAAGSTAYDFFLKALPAAGYPIKGAYAGDTVAQFLLTTPSGATLQIDLYTNPNLTTRIEVRLPRA
jgi:hypothetical protein